MSEAEIRQAIEEAKAALSPAPPKGRGVLRTIAATAAVGLGLVMVTACYGAPMPRPRSPASPARQGQGDPASSIGRQRSQDQARHADPIRPADPAESPAAKQAKQAK